MLYVYVFNIDIYYFIIDLQLFKLMTTSELASSNSEARANCSIMLDTATFPNGHLLLTRLINLLCTTTPNLAQMFLNVYNIRNPVKVTHFIRCAANCARFPSVKVMDFVFEQTHETDNRLKFLSK